MASADPVAEASAAPVAEVPLPPGWRLRPARGMLRLAGGRLLVGGSPMRLLALSERGARLAEGWWAGAPVSDRREEGLLVRRLLDAGLADPEPPPEARPPALTVVVPVRGAPRPLSRCLAALDGRWPIIVVDDGSPDAESIASTARRFGARCVRHETSRGAAAARNTGLRLAETELVVFLDDDCVPGPGFPGALPGHLADPCVGLVAPRIVSILSPGAIAAYERTRSALDMGAFPAAVRPYGRVAFVPAAALLARRAALGGGFDERLHSGEDVDLVWRLHDAGWRVRYDPSVTVEHPPRARLGAWYRRRVTYHESVAALHRRHPGRVPVLLLSPSAALAWGTALAGRPSAVAILALARWVRVQRLLSQRAAGGAPLAAAGIAGAATAREGRDVARALAGPWSPLLALAFLTPAGRRSLRHGACLLSTWLTASWLAERPRLDPLRYATLRLAEESARGAGIWLGCLRARELAPLLPARPPRAAQPTSACTPAPSSA